MIGFSSIAIFAAGCITGYYFASGKSTRRSKSQKHKESTGETKSRKEPVREAENQRDVKPKPITLKSSTTEPVEPRLESSGVDESLLHKLEPIEGSDFKGEGLPPLGESSQRSSVEVNRQEVASVVEEVHRTEPVQRENKAVVALLDDLANVVERGCKTSAEDWLYVAKELKDIGDTLEPARLCCTDEHDMILQALKRIGGLLEELDMFSMKIGADKDALAEAARLVREIVLRHGGHDMPAPQAYDGIFHKNVLAVVTPVGAPIKEILTPGLLFDGEVLKRAFVKA